MFRPDDPLLERRAGRERLGGRELPRTVEHFAELVGRVPLKNLVRETTDLIERLCIEAALELTGDNRASAAEMLGLSRQGFYAKLRRYGLGDLGDGGGVVCCRQSLTVRQRDRQLNLTLIALRLSLCPCAGPIHQPSSSC